jgi:hypothetical protein
VSGLRQPDLSYVIPGWSENRWSDLLASLIKTDPGPIAQLIGAAPDDVRREVAVPGQTSRKSDRLDLLLMQGNRQLAAIEVKVLSDLGLDQLARYTGAFPDVEARYVLHLAALPVNTATTPGWGELSWEAVLQAYAQSDHPWVAATALAWLGQLDRLVPPVDEDTVWNDVPDDAPAFELALRARIAWVAHHLDGMSLERDLVQSSGGGIWVLRFWADTTVPNLRVQVEVQEGMTAYEWRHDPDRRYRDRLKGPAPVVSLRLSDVDSSEAFDWGLLRRVFAEHVLDENGDALPDWPWQLTAANPRHPVDRAAWKAMVEAGGPKWLGKGFGMAVATKAYRECLFGARMQFAPTLTLGQVRSELLRLESLVLAMSATVDVSPH